MAQHGLHRLTLPGTAVSSKAYKTLQDSMPCLNLKGHQTAFRRVAELVPISEPTASKEPPRERQTGSEGGKGTPAVQACPAQRLLECT